MHNYLNTAAASEPSSWVTLECERGHNGNALMTQLVVSRSAGEDMKRRVREEKVSLRPGKQRLAGALKCVD